MKKILQLEEFLMFAASLYYFPTFGLSWWWFAALILVPDIGMLGYLVNARIGAITYNIFHHRGVALLIFFSGLFSGLLWIQFTGFILFSHSSMDRMLGYGLKYDKGFQFTHLGLVGKNNGDNVTAV